MKVVNIHERMLDAKANRVGSLIDSLSSRDDRLWPKHIWPSMQFDRSLGTGARGGHGPIRYFVEAYVPGRTIRFRFTGPRGLDGFHAFEVVSGTGRSVLLRHTLMMDTRGRAIVSWPLIFRPLHDALIEDALSKAEASLDLVPHVRAWSLWVRILRWAISRGQARPQATSNNAPQARRETLAP